MSISSPDRMVMPLQGPMTHSQLELGITATGRFFSEGNIWAQEIVGEIEGISANLSQIPGYRGSFGLGYPFYALDSTNNTVADVPAVREHIEGAQGLIGQSRAFAGEVWPCATCQETRGLPDLKSQCRPCGEVLFKPRDLFKALPDIDVVTIFDEPTAETEAWVQSILQELDLLQSDTDIRGSFIRTVRAMEGTDRNKLPLDAHIWSAEAFTGHCALLQEYPEQLDNIITGRSLHTKWEDHPINFWFDFVFSLTEVGDIDPSLQEQVKVTRQAIFRKLGADKIVTLVGIVSERGKAILADPTMEKIFRERVDSWQEL